MALAVDTPRVYDTVSKRVESDLPVSASETIYNGSAIGLDGGYARPLAAADVFKGFALENADNAAGADAAINCRIASEGFIYLCISSIAVTNEGELVYASDDGTFTLTMGGNSPIGFVHRWVSTGYAIVKFCEEPEKIAAIADPTDAASALTQLILVIAALEARGIIDAT